VIVLAVEAVAGATILQSWIPGVPIWVFSLALVLILTATNLYSVRSYGEFEFWFASIKVSAIIGFSLIMLAALLGVIGDTGASARNLTGHGGFFAQGDVAVLSAVSAVMFAIIGGEIATIAAAESDQPSKAVARTASRIMFVLSNNGDAPKAMEKLTRRGVPLRAILAATAFGFGSVVVEAFSPSGVFQFLLDTSGTVVLLVYLMMAASQLILRRRLEATDPGSLTLKMWLFPGLTIATIAAMLAVLVSMAFIHSLRSQLFWSLPSAAAVLLAYWMVWMTRRDSPFYIRPRPQIVPWLLRFARAALDRRKADAASALLGRLARDSLVMHGQLADSGIATTLERRSIIYAFETEAGFQQAIDDLSAKRELGLTATVLDPAQACDVEPGLAGGLVGAIHVAEEAHVDSPQYVEAMGRAAA
jgi:amino acid permease